MTKKINTLVKIASDPRFNFVKKTNKRAWACSPYLLAFATNTGLEALPNEVYDSQSLRTLTPQKEEGGLPSGKYMDVYKQAKKAGNYTITLDKQRLQQMLDLIDGKTIALRIDTTTTDKALYWEGSGAKGVVMPVVY